MQETVNQKSSDYNIIAGLKACGIERRKFETKLYQRFEHLIKVGSRKYSMAEDKSASAYSNTIIAVIKNILTDKYEGRAPLENYIYPIFFNKCVDELRSDSKHIDNMRRTQILDDLINKMPDKNAGAIHALIKKEQWSLLFDKLKTLGENCNKILQLWSNHYSDQEIADIMEYRTAKVARVSRVRCLEKLQNKNSNNPDFDNE